MFAQLPSINFRTLLQFICVWIATAMTIASTAHSQQQHSPDTTDHLPRLANHSITISGPYHHRNLTIYLIHGADQLQGKVPMTLEEAMAKGKVKVYETGQVNELAIENTSGEEVYIQGGDIVKGGRQDRTLPNDFILSANSGKVPISSFCVEQSRWSGRGNEAATHFSASSNMLSGRELKLAAKMDADQSKVWANVQRTQEKLRDNGIASVNNPQSETSLQLSLENGELQQMQKEYVEELMNSIEGKQDVIGYIFAINGTLNSGDIYSSHQMFKKLWPRLLTASAIEAISLKDQDTGAISPTTTQVQQMMTDADAGRSEERRVGGRIKMVTRQTEKHILFETLDAGRNNQWIHRNYMLK